MIYVFKKKQNLNLDKVVVTDSQWYELNGVSFSTNTNRDKPLSEFQALVSSCKSGVLYIRCDRVAVEFEENIYDTTDIRYFACIPSSTSYFGATSVKNPLKDRPRILTEYVDYIATERGYARTFVAYRFPNYLPEGFLISTLGVASEIALKWWKVPHHKILPSLESSISRKRAIGGLKESIEIQSIMELANRIKGGQDIISFILYFVVSAESKVDLDEKSKVLVDTLKSYGVEVKAPRFYQAALYSFPEKVPFMNIPFFNIKKIYTDSYSIRALFPLIKESLVDMGGVFIGFSGTGDPVVYNPYRRQNYLFLILGESGSGKSMSSKIYLSRLHSKMNLPIYGVDPESEYTRVAGYFCSVGVEVVEGERLGLDPLKIDMDRVLTAEALSEIYSVPRELRPRLRKELYSTTKRNIFDFIESCDSDLKRYLEPITAPPDRLIFEGEPPDFSKPAIFGLRGLRSDHLKLLTTSLISTYLLQNLNQNCAVFVDEGWLFLSAPKIMAVFENLARRGRKYGIHFLFITQRVEDVASSPEGRTLMEQAATVLLLGQEREGVDLVREIYKLTPDEANFIINANPGEGLLKAETTRIFLRVVPTNRELQLFSTSPMISY